MTGRRQSGRRRAMTLVLSALAGLVLLGGVGRAGPLDMLSITAPADMTVTADRVCFQLNCAQVFYSFTVSGGTPPYSLICGPVDSGGLFLVGTHVVSCMAQDSRGSSTRYASFTLTVLPGGPPPPPPPPPPATLAITAPADMTVTADQVCFQLNCAQVFYSFTVSGGSPPYSLVCTPVGSGGLFLVGTHTVSCLAQDSHGNSTPEASFTLTVLPGGPPPAPPPPPPAMLAITAPANMTVTADQMCGQSNCARVVYTFTVSGGAPPYSLVCTPVVSGGLFLVGTHTVSCLAQDSHGNSTPNASFTLTVIPPGGRASGTGGSGGSAGGGSGGSGTGGIDSGTSGSGGSDGGSNAAAGSTGSSPSGPAASNGGSSVTISLAGAPEVGHVVTAHVANGTAAHYLWQLERAGRYRSLAGETRPRLLVRSSYIGARLRLRVTLANSRVFYSRPTARVQA